MSNATTTRQKNAAAVIKAANAVSAAMLALKEAALVAGQSYADIDCTRTADAYRRLPEIVDGLIDTMTDTVSVADTGSLMDERNFAGFPTMTTNESRCSHCNESTEVAGTLTDCRFGRQLCEDCRGELCADEDYARYNDD